MIYIVNVKKLTSFNSVRDKYFPQTKFLFEQNPNLVSLLLSNDEECSEKRQISNEALESFASDYKLFHLSYDDRSKKFFGLIRKAILKKIGFSQG